MARKTLSVDDKEYPFFRTIRSRVMFARGEFSTEDLAKGNMDAIVYSAWCILFGASLREHKNFPYSYEEFIDVCPDNIVEAMLEMDGITPAMIAEIEEAVEKKTTAQKK